MTPAEIAKVRDEIRKLGEDLDLMAARREERFDRLEATIDRLLAA